MAIDYWKLVKKQSLIIAHWGKHTETNSYNSRRRALLSPDYNPPQESSKENRRQCCCSQLRLPGIAPKLPRSLRLAPEPAGRCLHLAIPAALRIHRRRLAPISRPPPPLGLGLLGWFAVQPGSRDSLDSPQKRKPCPS